MRRTALILALLASTPVAAADEPPETGQFLDKSIVTLPGSTGDYRLADIRYDSAQWMQGVISRWVVNAAPRELRVTMFVHPMGRTTEENALALQSAEVAHFMDEAVKQGVYTDLVAGEREPFVVVAPNPSLHEGNEAPAGTMPRPEPAIAADGDSNALAAALPSPNTSGQRQSFAFTEKGVPMRSLDYLFYRHLFAFKVRVAAPVESMDEALFAALADTAVRKLVPRVDIRNYGQCGNLALPAPGTGADDETPKASGQQLVLAMARIRADNCAVAEDAKSADETDGERRVEIVYPPDTWRTGG